LLNYLKSLKFILWNPHSIDQILCDKRENYKKRFSFFVWNAIGTRHSTNLPIDFI